MWIKMSLWTSRKQTVIAGVLPLIIKAFTSDWLASRPGHFTRGEKIPWHPMNWRLCRFQNWSERFGKQNDRFLLPAIEPRLLGLSSPGRDRQMHTNTGVKRRRKSPLRKLRSTREDNIKKDIQEIVPGDVH